MKISSILALDLTQGNYSYMRTKERQEKNSFYANSAFLINVTVSV